MVVVVGCVDSVDQMAASAAQISQSIPGKLGRQGGRVQTQLGDLREGHKLLLYNFNSWIEVWAVNFEHL